MIPINTICINIYPFIHTTCSFTLTCACVVFPKVFKMLWFCQIGVCRSLPYLSVHLNLVGLYSLSQSIHAWIHSFIHSFYEINEMKWTRIESTSEKKVKANAGFLTASLQHIFMHRFDLDTSFVSFFLSIKGWFVMILRKWELRQFVSLFTRKGLVWFYLLSFVGNPEFQTT